MNNLHSGLILIVAGLLLLVLPKKTWKWAAALGPVLSLVAAMGLNESSHLEYQFTAKISLALLHVDNLSWIFVVVLCIITVIAGVYSFDTKTKLEKAASLIYAGGSIAVVLAGDWITLIAFWELTAVVSTYLVWAGRTNTATRASYRYLAIHFFGGNLLLAGALCLCLDGNFDVGLLTDASGYGYWFMLIGIGVNAALPPLHTWVADAYPESTNEGIIYLGSYTTKVAIYALIRVFAGTEILIYLGAFLAVYAVCMALLENDLKRLLSYHIVSQLGMMVAALGTGTDVGIDGATMHALFNILYKGVLLMVAGAVVHATGMRKISELGGLWKKMPLVSLCFLIASLAIAGMPGLNGFVSKGLIMQSLVGEEFIIAYWMVLLAGIGTWLSITMKINYYVFFGKTTEHVSCSPVPIQMKIALISGTVLCIITGIFPQLSYQFMPNQTIGHPFTIEHVMEYLGLFVGATIAFGIFIKKMEPHNGLSIDFDWFYRKPMVIILMWLSSIVFRFFNRFDRTYKTFYDRIRLMLNNPGKVFSRIAVIKEEEVDGEIEEERPVGEFMQTFIIFCIIAFFILLIIE